MGKYLLTSMVRTRLQSIGFNLVCYKCGRALQIGDRVESRSGGRQRRVKKLYHEACYESLFSERARARNLLIEGFDRLMK